MTAITMLNSNSLLTISYQSVIFLTISLEIKYRLVPEKINHDKLGVVEN